MLTMPCLQNKRLSLFKLYIQDAKQPIKQGFKIFALADHGYVWYFQLSLKEHEIRELKKVDEPTPTS